MFNFKNLENAIFDTFIKPRGLEGKGWPGTGWSDDSPLLLAVEKGCVREVKALVSKGYDVNATSVCLSVDNKITVETTITPLLLAAQYNNVAIVKILVKAGAEVNSKLPDGTTPLHLASQRGFIDIVKVLIEEKANVNVRDHENCTPLHLAVKNEPNHIEVMKCLLLVNGIDVTIKATSGYTVLHLVSQYGLTEIAKLLLEKKSNVNAKTNEGFTPLHVAIQHCHVELCEFLIKNGADINSADDQNWTPLHNAAYNGFSLIIVKSLILKGAKVNAKTSEGATILHLAAENNFVQILNLLIENGADINARDQRQWTALHYAAFDGNVKCAKSLLAKGVDIDAKAVKNRVPLHFAVENNHLEMVQFLLKKGANVNARDNASYTPLHLAAEKGHDSIATLLLQHGADISLKQNEKATALHLAVQHNRVKVVKTLFANGAEVNDKIKENVTALHLGALSGNLDMVKFLIQNGEHYDARSEGKCVTPLEFAEKFKKSTVIDFLKLTERLFKATIEDDYLEVEKCLKEGAMPNTRSVRYKNPLLYASWKGFRNTVIILLENGADVNITTEDYGLTPLHYAAKFTYVDIAFSLLHYGAMYDNVSRGKIKNEILSDKTPLDLSKNTESEPMVALFLSIMIYFEEAKNGHFEMIREFDVMPKKNPKEFLVLTNARNKKGQTLLQVAFAHHHKTLANYLVKVLKENDVNELRSKVNNLKLKR